MALQINGSKTAVYARSELSLSPIDLHKSFKKSSSFLEQDKNNTVIHHPELPGVHIPIDFETWLPFCAPHYKISPDPKDYVLTPVIVMPSDLPNRNKVGFPLKELIKFDPKTGMQAYKTWKGKPTYLEHQNNDITKSYGVIVDSFMRKLTGWSDDKIWKVVLLLAFDRTKHPDVVDNILAGDSNAYSMGAWVSHYECSYCGAEVGKCDHLIEGVHYGKNRAASMYELNGKLVFPNCCGIEGFETSSVETPAFISAISDKRISYAT